ncbi:MAG: glycoside hydrolase domain-containing protein [Spirochaetia bacterium]
MTGSELKIVTEGPYRKMYPAADFTPEQKWEIHVPRNGTAAFQIGLRREWAEEPEKISCRLQNNEMCEIRIRTAGAVPQPHFNTGLSPSQREGNGMIPGFVFDPLYDTDEMVLPPGETGVFWLSLKIPEDFSPGEQVLYFLIRSEQGESRTVRVPLKVYSAVIRKRENFPVTNWFYSDALLDYYRIESFDGPYWKILKPYLQNLVSHGQDTVYVPALTPSLDGIKRPTQLLRIGRQDWGYTFDWDDTERYIKTALTEGIEYFEWPHLFTQWGAKNGIRIYQNQGEDEKLLLPPETGADSPAYREFLKSFLNELKKFLDQNGLMNRSFFHVSDEPHGPEDLTSYSRARNLLRETAPWMKTMDALSDIQYAEHGLTDTPIASVKTAKDFLDSGISCWGYFCCSPKGDFLNRHMDTPLSKIGMSGFLFYKLGIRGFLHWGYNYWYRRASRELIDPFTVTDAGAWPEWAYGDPFTVYPGPEGPIDSIRWEVFSLALEDYALLQTLETDPNSPVLSEIRSFSDFPNKSTDPENIRRKLLQR